MLPESYEAQLTRFRAEKKRMNALFRFLEKKSKKELDSLFYPLYQEIFFRYDCGECANCCSVLGPRFADKDIERLAAYFRMKKKQFAACYLEGFGREVAEDTYEKHRFFTEMLVAAGVDPVTAERDACRIEHVISKETFERLKAARKLSEKAVISSDES